jgi:hypothetical protein
VFHHLCVALSAADNSPSLDELCFLFSQYEKLCRYYPEIRSSSTGRAEVLKCVGRFWKHNMNLGYVPAAPFVPIGCLHSCVMCL